LEEKKLKGHTRLKMNIASSLEYWKLSVYYIEKRTETIPSDA
jgi:hypothetical protein